MIKNVHSDETKKFFQKLLLFADSTINQAIIADSSESQKIVISGLINIKDAIFSEIVRDNYAISINESLLESQKKKEKDIINQEQELEKDRQV